MIVRKVEKISRNQKPCKCGKDIKYKYCCGKVENNYVKPPTKKPIWYSNFYDLEQAILDLHKISNEVCEKIGDDMVFSPIGKKIEVEKKVSINSQNKTNLLVSKYGYIRLKLYEIPSKPKPCIELDTIEIREKYRCKGIGTRWIKSIIKITEVYGYELVLSASSIDYDENYYEGNKKFRGIWCPILKAIDNHIGDGGMLGSQMETFMNESIERYEETSPKQRVLLHRKNSERLMIYYSQLGFIPLDLFTEGNGYMIYENGLVSKSVKKLINKRNKGKILA